MTDAVDFSRAATFYACGARPDAAGRLRKGGDLWRGGSICPSSGAWPAARARVSAARSGPRPGNRRVCRDGPVFPFEEVRDVL